MRNLESAEAFPPADPALRASAMLLRLGFAIFALVIPSATLMSRWVIVILVPIGAVLIILANVLREDPLRFWRQIFTRLRSFPGLFGLFFAIWAIESLAWTPNPGEASNKLFKALGVVLLGFLAVNALPMRMRASNLHLVTIGVALGATLILIANLSRLLGAPVLVFPAATPGRVAVLLTSLVWIGLAWMLIKNSRLLAALLVGLVMGAVGFGAADEAVLPLLVGLFVLAIAWNAPERVGDGLAWLFGCLILGGPLIAFGALLISKMPGLEASIFAEFGRWWSVSAADPLRMITGRGFDAANALRTTDLIPADARIGLLSDIWFDLGALGAFFLGGIVVIAFRAVSRFGLELAPAALASLSAALIFAIAERGATQTWWLNGMIVLAVVLMSVERGRYRTVRPRADLKRRAREGLNTSEAEATSS